MLTGALTLPQGLVCISGPVDFFRDPPPPPATKFYTTRYGLSSQDTVTPQDILLRHCRHDLGSLLGVNNTSRQHPGPCDRAAASRAVTGRPLRVSVFDRAAGAGRRHSPRKQEGKHARRCRDRARPVTRSRRRAARAERCFD